MYNVFSAHGEALVTVEASRSGFNETIEFICIDVSFHHYLLLSKISHVFDLIPSILVQVDTSASIQNEDDEKRKRILVKGSDDKFKMADQLHSYIEFKK